MTAFQVKTGLSDAMTGLGDELEEIKGMTSEFYAGSFSKIG